MEATLFLPGILMPAALRYAPLLAALGDAVRPVVKELEVYQGDVVPPPGYSLETELAGIDRIADEAHLDRFHLYGHSGGGAVAIAYTARRAARVLSLAVDEPASDFSEESLDELRSVFLPLLDLPPDEMMQAFISRQLRDGASPPSPPGLPPAWMGTRPAGVRALVRALSESPVLGPSSDFDGPVYYSHGSLSSASWTEMRDRLARRFRCFTSDEYQGASHLRTSHMVEPERVARALLELWERKP